jgi:hypothetical protein
MDAAAVRLHSGKDQNPNKPWSVPYLPYLQGPKAYSGQFRLKTQSAAGKPEQIDMTQSGTWLSDQCPSP